MAAPVDDPGGRPDATGRRLEYLPAAVIGNGSLLVTLSARGEVERLLWPHVDGPNAVVELRLGLVGGGEADAAWLDEDARSWSQAWVGESSVLQTTAATDAGAVLVEDAVDPVEPVLVRRVEAPPGAVVVTCAPRLGGDTVFTGAFVDPESRAVVFHRRDVALAIATDRTVTHAGVEPADGPPDDVAHVGPVRGRLEVEHAGDVHVVVCFGSSPFDALSRARRHAGVPEAAAARRREADGAAVAGLRASASEPSADRLVRRSVLVLEQLTDRATGGIVAAPEMDERFAESGGYGFVWPRDHSYVVLALLAARRAEQAAVALRWLARVQTPEGLWLHRHWTTGELAPSWGLHQLDETGVALFAMEAAWEELGDAALDEELHEHVVRGADFLVSAVDSASGLPYASVDLWEQQDGQHTYSAAAIVGGLRAAARAAARHGEAVRGDAYAAAADGIAAAIDDVLWDAALGRYRRAVNVVRARGGEAPPRTAFDRSLPYPNRRVVGVAPVDDTLDCSLLGLAWPFRALDPASERVRSTVDAVEEGLASPGGGLRRQAGDTYAGGHEWLLATLWLGLARRALGDPEALDRSVAHVVARRTALDLLAEQVDAHGRPAWVLPLGWSHAMLLLAALPELRLVDALGAERSAGDGRGG
jgi:glucoamylase